MSQGAAPCCGYMLEATEENFLKFGVSKQQLIELANKNLEQTSKSNNKIVDEMFLPDVEFTELVDWFYSENVNVLLHLPTGDLETEVIRYNREDGDIYDQLEDGYYFYFGENELYDMKLNKTGEALRNMGMLPEFKLWTNFG